MKEELKKKGIDMLVPFLVGGAVGAGAALLLAPKPGNLTFEQAAAVPLAAVGALFRLSDELPGPAKVGANPIDGSSSSSSWGEDASPRPIATICCSPPDSVPASWLRRSASTGNVKWGRTRFKLFASRPS